jgi:hypothetical protein
MPSLLPNIDAEQGRRRQTEVPSAAQYQKLVDEI